MIFLWSTLMMKTYVLNLEFRYELFRFSLFPPMIFKLFIRVYREKKKKKFRQKKQTDRKELEQQDLLNF